jgi:WhiB family redox-sensing transcriptional regulator
LTPYRGTNRAEMTTEVRSRFPVDQRSSTWYYDTACGPDTTHLFFNDTFVRRGLNAERARAAIKICRSCPVIDRCLDSALTMRHEPWGVMGGMTPEQLGVLRRKLRHTERTGVAV